MAKLKKTLLLPSKGGNKAFIIIDNCFIKDYYAEKIQSKIHKCGLTLYQIEESYSNYNEKLSFNLEYISKYDRKELNTKANYIIKGIKQDTYLSTGFSKGYIHLSRLEKFRIDYDKKESFVQKANVPSLIIGGATTLFFSIILLLITSIFSSPDKPVKKSDSTINNQEVKNTSDIQTKKDTTIISMVF